MIVPIVTSTNTLRAPSLLDSDEAGRRNSSRFSFAVTAVVGGPGYKARKTKRPFTRRCFAARATMPGRSHSIERIRRFRIGCFATAATLHSKEEIDFAEIYGDAHAEKSLNLLRYFANSLGCRIADAGIKPPEGLRRVLTDVNLSDTKPLAVTFAINEFWHRICPSGQMMGNDCLCNWPEIIDRSCFSWVATLGYLDIFHWYDLEWEDGYPFGSTPMWRSCRAVSLGRYDPLPDEPAASMMELDGGDRL